MTSQVLDLKIRPLRFRFIYSDYPFDALGSTPPAIADPPDPLVDYRESSFEELIDLDLSRASLIIEPSYYCNLRCSFCMLPVTSRTMLDWGRLSVPLQAFALCGVRSATLTGGEPGIIDDLPNILGDLRHWGMRVTLLTHGLWAANSCRLNDILADGRVDMMWMSVKAFDQDTFRTTAGRGSLFTKQSLALANIAKAVTCGNLRRWTINHVVTSETIGQLMDVFRLDCLSVKPELVFSLVEPYLPEMVNHVPDPSRVRDTVAELTSNLDERGVHYSFEGFPLCLLGGAWRKSLDIARLDDHRLRILLQPRQDADYVLAYRGYQRLRQFQKIAECCSCVLAQFCPGIHARLTSNWGKLAVRPIAFGKLSE
jgi:hypothetical protein